MFGGTHHRVARGHRGVFFFADLGFSPALIARETAMFQGRTALWAVALATVKTPMLVFFLSRLPRMFLPGISPARGSHGVGES